MSAQSTQLSLNPAMARTLGHSSSVRWFLFAGLILWLTGAVAQAMPEQPTSRADCTPTAWVSINESQTFLGQRAEFRREWDSAAAQCMATKADRYASSSMPTSQLNPDARSQ